MAKRSHQSTDDAQKFTGASSKSTPVGSRKFWEGGVLHSEGPLVALHVDAADELLLAARCGS